MKKDMIRKALEKVSAMPLDQAAELLNIRVPDILKLIRSGQIESISFGGGEVNGVTLSSFLDYQEKIVADRVLKSKTYANAKKGFDLFFSNNCENGQTLKQNIPAFYETYRRWTDKNGYLTMDKVQLCEYLENVCKYQSSITENERVFSGFSLLGAQERVCEGEDVLLETVLQNYNNLRGVADDILRQVNEIVPDNCRPVSWPATPTSMGMWLTVNKGILKSRGILLRRGKRTASSRGHFFFEAIN